MMTETTDIASRLRQETRDLHDAAENHEFQRAFGGGRLPRETYVRYLEQMLHVYTALESAIRDALPKSEVLSAVVGENNFRADDLRADLAYFDSPADATPQVDATGVFVNRVEQVARENPDALLGYHYVLEGSNNGSKFIAKNIRRAYGFQGDTGTRYLDPYGDQQRDMWLEYKTALSNLRLNPKLSDEVVACAREMFQTVSRISSELMEPATQT